MALPPGIIPKTVTLGPFTNFDGTVCTGRVTIGAPENVLYLPTGAPLVPNDMVQQLKSDGTASFMLCPTDADGLNRKDWTYRLTVEISGAAKQLDIRSFPLPSAGPDGIDLDSLVTVPSSAGVPISVDVLSKADFAPSLLTELNNTSSATSVALRAAFAAWGAGGVGAPTGALPVFATEDQAVADANPGYTWLILAPTSGGTPAADTTAPTVPTGLTATAGDAQVVLSWSASTDAVGVTGYRVYRGGTLIASPTATTYTDTGRTNGTQYSYTVAAADAAGNVSAQTAAKTATPAASGGGGAVAASIVSMQSTSVLGSVGGNTRSIALPATVAAGDVLVVLAALHDPPAYTFTAPAGWTTRLINGDAGNGNQGFVLTKTATGTEGGTSIATTWNVGPDETLHAQAYALRGIASETPVATGSGPLAYNSGPTAPALTGLPADTMVLAAGWAHTSPATSTPPTGTTQDALLSTGNETASFVHQYLASGGSAGGNAWTFSGSGNGGSLAVAFS